ncbi:hypothetical protein HFO56_33675 [Rhizobium laguerreae]|uniref:hypothetical protein n=1 Tax=Rhizobium laguerreae TaxID=1076926 RepID=UPI001C924C06|nr:hypothetical protein [Rhizobium laguerreae]MBY3157277.1 hypothetical protein [Rhizobium laguerreae]
MAGDTEQPKITWRHPDYLRKETACDVCKQGWRDDHPLRWWGRSSSVVCSRKECVEVMQGWWDETCRRVDEERSRQQENQDDEEVE